MKQISIMFWVCGLVAIFANGCMTTKQDIKEPTLENKNSTEVISADVEVIRAIEKEDTTGRVAAAREAAAKLIDDAKKRAKELTRNAETIYDTKKQEAEANAAKIIADARTQAEKAKNAIILSAEKEAGTVAEKAKKPVAQAPEISPEKMKEQTNAEIEKILAIKKAQTENIAKKIIDNAKKSAADISKAAYKNMLEAKEKEKNIIEKANVYAKDKKKEADDYLGRKMAEADKAVAEFSRKMDKEIKNSGIPKTEDEIKAQRMVDEILKAIPENDYQTFSKDFTVDLKQRFTKEKFLNTNKTLDEKLGGITKITYLGYIVKGPLTVYMWKANFAKATKDNDMVVRLTLGELDKKMQVFAFDIAVL